MPAEACESQYRDRRKCFPSRSRKVCRDRGSWQHVAVSKYADHQPLYRQEGIFKRFGVELSPARQCAIGWLSIAELLEPTRQADDEAGFSTSKVVQNDDTTVPVQEPRAAKESRPVDSGLSVGDHYNHYVVYCYTPDHSGDLAAGDLQGFQGLSPGRRLLPSTMASVQIEARSSRSAA